MKNKYLLGSQQDQLVVEAKREICYFLFLAMPLVQQRLAIYHNLPWQGTLIQIPQPERKSGQGRVFKVNTIYIF
jgi:hypothetical protein